jgi:hypothetical protein
MNCKVRNGIVNALSDTPKIQIGQFDDRSALLRAITNCVSRMHDRFR